VRKVAVFAVMVVAFAALEGSASASDVPRPISISVHRDASGDVWASAGAIVDAGTMQDTSAFTAGSSSTYHTFRTFTGADGTFTARADVTLTATADPSVIDVTGRWAVTSGTGAYLGLHGAGRVHESFDTSVPAITGTWTGWVTT
jgi:hypothetical protein